ncbi:MAG: hypothetical protein GDA40_10140 [Rhodobacteraceae bacterium]|nr:hypothetical protein [Paracoccaceae bacterium]
MAQTLAMNLLLGALCFAVILALIFVVIMGPSWGYHGAIMGRSLWVGTRAVKVLCGVGVAAPIKGMVVGAGVVGTMSGLADAISNTAAPRRQPREC